jgi:hypothetical protein
MARKAVLVGVGNYRGYATRLDAPALEVQNWRDLLGGYDFDSIDTLVDAQASRNAVRKAFMELVRNTQRNDQLLFLFAGHGRIVPAHTRDDDFEEALIVYPDKDDKDLKNAEITDSDISEIIADADLAEDVDLTFILETCFSALFQIELPPKSKPLFVPSVMKNLPSIDRIREFGSLGGADKRLLDQSPLIVAACGRTETAIELEIQGVPRGLFSFRAIDYLEKDVKHQATAESLVHDIQPLLKDLPQMPETRGNPALAREYFPGEAETNAPASRMPKAATATANRTMASTTVNSIDVRFAGICCFADARRESDPYAKRVLLPYDDRIDPDKKHIPYLEIAEEELVNGQPNNWTWRYQRDQIWFVVWDLTGYAIKFVNADQSQPLAVTYAFHKHIPGMQKGICGHLPYNPHDSCFDSPPPLKPKFDPPHHAGIAAYTDLRYGTLGIGPLENFKTTFYPKDGPFDDRMPKYVLLQLPLTSPDAQIDLNPYAGGPFIRIGIQAPR